MDNNKSNIEDNLVASLVFKFMPFWPLFAFLLVVCLFGAWGYLRYYAIPSYGVYASLIVKDEKKGVSDSKMTESIDAFTTNKIVENEMNVLRSHALMKQVVNELGLYVSVYAEDKFKSVPAYTLSPITITLKSPEKVTEQTAAYFTYDQVKRKVNIDNKSYPLDQWIDTPYGELLFSENKKNIAATDLPLYFTISNPRDVANSLLGRVSIETPGKLSSVINLYIEDPEPQRGEDILNALINAYQQAAVIDKNRLAAQTLEFVENRIELVEEELNELENKIVSYRSAKGAVNLNEQGRLFLQNVGENDRKISEINIQLAVLDKVKQYVVSKNNNAGIVPSTLGVSDPVLSQLLKKLYDADIQYQQLSKTTAENNPILISLRGEIENIRPSILENIQNQRDNLQASLVNLASTNNSYNAVLQTIPHKERELLEISRQQAIKNEAYKFLLQKREETVLSNAPTGEDVRIVDMAEPSKYPHSPKPMYAYMSAVLLALGAGVALVVSKELLNSKVLFRSEIESYINAPIVAELSSIKSPNKEAFKEPKEIAEVEQFRQLRVTMGLYGRTFTKKKIMVTSSIPGEGKSYVSTNLAYSLATSGKKVALLDFDLRNPNTSVLFESYETEGIIEYLTGNVQPDEIIKATPFDNLYIVPAGLNVGDHTELLLNGKLESLFAYLEEAFDYIIIDTPPVDLVSDAFLLAEYSDIKLLVIRHAYTPKSLVQRFAQNNKLRSMQNVAVVFNGVKPRGFIKGQYGYGYGYGHDHKYNDKTYRTRKKTA